MNQEEQQYFDSLSELFASAENRIDFSVLADEAEILMLLGN